MSSRGYYKTCGRKLAPTPPSQSIQFNKIFCENSNKPSAAKSTGTLGKWGITSFTSIRSTSFTMGRKADTVGYKRTRYDTTKSNDSYNFSSVSPTPALSPVQPKPKKFFKSRTVEGDKADPPVATTTTSKKCNKYSRGASVNKRSTVIDSFEDSELDQYGSDNVEKSTYSLEKTNSEEKISHASETESPVKEEKEDTSNAASNSHNPPIVLRIFKGTAQLITDDNYLPPKKEKESRRRLHSTDSYEYGSPKKHKHRLKDLETLRNDLEDTERVTEEVQNVPLQEIPIDATIDEVKTEVEEKIAENDQVLQEGEALLESTSENIDERIDEILDLSANNEMKEEPYCDELDEPCDVPLDLHIPAPDKILEEIKEEKDIKEEVPIIIEEERVDTFIPEDIAVKNEKEESNSDSDYSETQERPSVVQLNKNQPPIPKLNLKPVKKGSIFKSRGEKRNAHYIHKWTLNDKEEGNKLSQEPLSTKVVEGEFSEVLTRVTNYTKPDEFSEETETFTSVTCSKTAKEFYTVVRNVKKVHQLQESGEFQEFNDDVEYLLDSLQDNNPTETRCLSAIKLASKCMVPAFRMHVRAHGTVAKFFKALHDASKDQSLGMCTATVMFVLSQDRLNMDLDRESLELMLSLLESDASSQALDECGFTDAQLAKTKDRVRSLCQEIKEHGHANHLNLDNITVGQLAMETLLSLTSKRAGEWFKEELRDLGGLEHIVRTIVETASCVDPGVTTWNLPLLDRMRKLDRCLKVLENVTLNNEENSNYLMAYRGGELVDTVLRVFMTCASQLLLYPVTSSKDKQSVGAVLKDCLIGTLKILINVTHDFNNKSCGSALAGTKPGLIDTSLHVLLIVPDYVPDDQKFDLTFMSLMLLINLVEHCEANRRLLIEAQAPPNPDVLFDSGISAISALVNLFVQQEELARNVERKTDAILDGENKPPEQSKSHEEFIEETVALLLQKAGKHMEYTFVAAYIATLLGYLTINNEEFEYIIRNSLPNQNYSLMLSVLHKFYNFMTLTAASGSASSRGIKATEMLIKHLTETDSKTDPQLQ